MNLVNLSFPLTPTKQLPCPHPALHSIILPPSGFGSHHHYSLLLRREEPEQLVLVTDRQMRIRHVSVGLAHLLDSTVDGLQVCGTKNERRRQRQYGCAGLLVL